MNPPSKDIVEILTSSAKGLDLVFGTTLFRSFQPESPNFCITIRDTGGYPAQSGYIYEHPTLQVLGRGNVFKYDLVYAQMVLVHGVLHDLHGEDWGLSRYIGIWAMSDIIDLGYDESNRPELSQNYRIHRTTK